MRILLPTTPGIHLFMALYGLSVFMETPESLRKGRKRYIITSFVITALSALTASLDMAQYFHLLFKSTSPNHWKTLWDAAIQSWDHWTSSTALGCVMMIGDVLLVRGYPITVLYTSLNICPGVSLLYSLRRISVGDNLACNHVPLCARFVSYPIQRTIVLMKLSRIANK